MYERADISYFKEPSELKYLIDTIKLVQKYLPKQTDIDKVLDVIKRKVLKATHLLIMIKEIQAGLFNQSIQRSIPIFGPEQITKQTKCHT